MIIDPATLTQGQAFEADVVIIGAGFAGIDLARTLGGAAGAGRRRVLLVESGVREFRPDIQALGKVTSVGKTLRVPSPDSPFTPYLPPIFRGEFRVRQFGGTSNIWTGKWRRFDDLDFSRRDWIPFSGWPLTRQELGPFYRQVAADYGLGDHDEFASRPEVRAAAAGLDEYGLKLQFHYWENGAFRPAASFGPELEQMENVRVLLGLNATQILLDDEEQSRITSIKCRTLDGRDVTVFGGQFVLSMGGMEAARLLLASDSQKPGGVGNARGLVGRFHQDHPKTKVGRLFPGPTMQKLHAWTKTRPRPCFHVSLALADREQSRRRTLDHAIYLRPVYDYNVDYPKKLLAALRNPTKPLASLSAGIRLLTSPSLLKKIARRWWFADDGGVLSHYAVSMYVEQAPDADSRVYLSGSEKDATGQPRLVVDWRLNDLDRQSLGRVLDGMGELFEKAGLGRLDFGKDALSLDKMVDAAHHIGSTRMSDSPETGVVDRDCRVFGTDNLYVASSSVFPTGHSAAPTFTILALARRLAAHLLEKSGRRG